MVVPQRVTPQYSSYRLTNYDLNHIDKLNLLKALNKKYRCIVVTFGVSVTEMARVITHENTCIYSLLEQSARKKSDVVAQNNG